MVAGQHEEPSPSDLIASAEYLSETVFYDISQAVLYDLSQPVLYDVWQGVL